MMDYTYLDTRDRYQTILTRHLIRHPEDEQHPLMGIIVTMLDQLEATPLSLADEHLSEARYLIRCARHATPAERSRLVHQARWHNDQALAIRRDTNT